MPARTIDEVLERLDEIIDLARREKSRLGYFAALYRNVTIKVNEGILAGTPVLGGFVTWRAPAPSLRRSFSSRTGRED